MGSTACCLCPITTAFIGEVAAIFITFAGNTVVIHKNQSLNNMRKNKSKPLALLVAGLLCAGLTQAQESVNSTGGNATGSGGTVSYTIGQVGYTTNTGSNGSVAQGVQQAYEILTVGINENEPKISFTSICCLFILFRFNG